MTTNNAINTPTPFSVANGGTGDSSFTAYSVLCGGTTTTNPLQNVSGIGTTGQVLQSQGASALPIWVPNNGAIIQIVSSTLTSAFTTTSTTNVDIGLSVTITPTYTSSKILICYFVNGANSIRFGAINLVRTSTSIFIGDAHGSAFRSTSLTVQSNNTDTQSSTSAMTYLDSPATTSATTYKLQAAVNAGTFFINESSASTGTSYGTYASTITAMEVTG